jgi:hypothetical protein
VLNPKSRYCRVNIGFGDSVGQVGVIHPVAFVSLPTNESLRVVKSGLLTYLTFTHGKVALRNRARPGVRNESS